MVYHRTGKRAAKGTGGRGQLSSDCRVHWSIKKFGAGGGQLAHKKKVAGLDQENRDGHTALRSLDSLAGPRRPQPGPHLVDSKKSGARCGAGPCSTSSTRHDVAVSPVKSPTNLVPYGASNSLKFVTSAIISVE